MAPAGIAKQRRLMRETVSARVEATIQTSGGRAEARKRIFMRSLRPVSG